MINPRTGDVALCVPTRYGSMIGGEICPRRLWSLWEMLELKAGAFYDVVTQLASLSSFVAGRSVDRPIIEGELYEPFRRESKLHDFEKKSLLTQLSNLEGHLVVLGTRVTLIAAQDARRSLAWDQATWHHAETRLEEIRNTLKRELSLITLLVLEPKEQGYYAPPQAHFGPDVATKFATEAAFEIDEAAKCLALGRSTAATFHLMRVMEIAIRAVTRCLGIPDPVRAGDRNWGNILREIKKDLDAHAGEAPKKRWALLSDRDFFGSAYASIDAVRGAWRNPTMHVEKKYTDEEAEHIFVAVRGFMSRLASRCDENGDPKA